MHFLILYKKSLRYFDRKMTSLKDTTTLILQDLSYEGQGKITQCFYVYVFLVHTLDFVNVQMFFKLNISSYKYFHTFSVK